MKTLILLLLFYCEYRNNELIVITDSRESYEKLLFSNCLLHSGYYNKTEGVEYVLYFEQNCSDSLINMLK